MVGGDGVVEKEGFGEDDEGVADEEMRDVFRQEVVDAWYVSRIRKGYEGKAEGRTVFAHTLV